MWLQFTTKVSCSVTKKHFRRPEYNSQLLYPQPSCAKYILLTLRHAAKYIYIYKRKPPHKGMEGYQLLYVCCGLLVNIFPQVT